MTFLQRHAEIGQVVTGLLYVDPEPEDLHRYFNTVDAPLNSLRKKSCARDRQCRTRSTSACGKVQASSSLRACRLAEPE